MTRRRVPHVPSVLMPRPKTGARVVPRAHPGRFVIVKLTTNHNINGVAYGIRECETEVRVREGVARTLQESEQRVAENTRRFLEPRDAIITLGYGNQPIVRRVRSGQLDAALAEAMRGHEAPALQLGREDMRAMELSR